ncbi:MAG TPA: peptidylprolyl isomerase [Bacteroidales bacterium]|nr:peptidylprolyl isomerase [Bacteroidales bacterium]
MSYYLGASFAISLKNYGLTKISIKNLRASFEQVQKGEKTLYTQMEMMTLLRSFFQALNAKQSVAKFDMEKVSYCLGMDLGRNTGALSSMNTASAFKGIEDLFNDKMAVPVEKIQKEVQVFYEKLTEVTKAEGQAFLAANKKKTGVKTLPSGMQYKVVKEGTGAKPKATDKVKTHYKGTFINGKVFDSSYARNEPAVFPVNQVIAGWTEALQLMSVGSTYELYIPGNLAYGEKGSPPAIPPHATLIFTVELISIEK